MSRSVKNPLSIVSRNPGSGAERRTSTRRTGVKEHGIVRARIRPAYDVSVIDLSAGGTLIEATHRLMPGTSVELHLRNAENEAQIIRGRVLRCTVSHISANGVRYRGAIVFERELPWLANDGPWVCDSKIGSSKVEVLVWPEPAAAPAAG
jgi:hypothetical protein